MSSDMIHSQIPGREPAFRGKVRDVYDLGAHLLLLVATDRISAFDVVLPTPIPGKGSVLTRLSSFWFDKTGDVVPNHLTDLGLDDITDDERTLANLAGRSVVVRKAEPLKIEAIVRGYLAGYGWLEHQTTGCADVPIEPTHGCRPANLAVSLRNMVAGQHDNEPDAAQLRAWREEFEAARRRPLRVRFRYAFIHTYKPVLDDASYRSFDTTAAYRAWCEDNLPSWLGYGQAV